MWAQIYNCDKANIVYSAISIPLSSVFAIKLQLQNVAFGNVPGKVLTNEYAWTDVWRKTIIMVNDVFVK